MKKLSVSIFAILATASLACSSSKSTPGTGTGGTDGSVPLGTLMPDPNGFMNGTVDGVIGAWYSYGDSYNTTRANNEGDCENAGFTSDQCSSATSPAFGAPFTNTDGNMCLTGTAAVVMDSNFSSIWGLGIGFDFNNAGGGDAGGNGNKLPWNATTYGVTGFKFDISGVPVGGNMRVEFPFMGQYMNDAPYWGGQANNLSAITGDGTYMFKWADVNGPGYLTSPTPPTFDPTMILSAQFHVVANTKGPIAVTNLCVKNVVLLSD